MGDASILDDVVRHLVREVGTVDRVVPAIAIMILLASTAYAVTIYQCHAMQGVLVILLIAPHYEVSLGLSEAEVADWLCPFPGDVYVGQVLS